VASLDQEWAYAGLDSCATDGLCATACPVDIDTGAMVTRMRAAGRSQPAQGVANAAAANYGALVALGRAAVRTGHAVGMKLPAPGQAAPRGRKPPAAVAVYFPSCTGRLFDGAGDPFLVLAERAGVPIRVPDGLDPLCCGLPFDSKGFPDAGAAVRARTVAVLRLASDDGALPIVVDGSSCAQALSETVGLAVIDSTAYASRHLLARLTIRRRLPDAALHLSCGAQHLGIEDDLRSLATAVAERVTVPRNTGCCGFAGDRGFSHPELTASATAPAAAEFAAAGHTLGLTSNLTCGIGMSRGCGIPFRNVLEVLEEVSR
jgi:D-lactate dehydrogenase